MKKYILLLMLVIAVCDAYGQCLTNSLVINTGYDPTTNSAITPGVNGGTPVPDPHWIVTAESPSVAVAILSTGLIEVTPGASADIVTTVGGWVSDPVGSPGGWITCLNSNTYTTDGTGPTGTPYNMTLTRPFRMCTDDSITLNFWIADDNYISSIDVDGVLTTFSQPAIANPLVFGSFAHFTQTFYLAAGTHNINVVVNNYNDVFVENNPTGLEIYGTVSSADALNSLVSESYLSCATYPCTSVCNAVSLPDSIHLCSGDSTVIAAVVTGTDSILSYSWSPPTGLSSTTVLTPTLTAGTTSEYYYLTVSSLIPFNLVANGDFSAGNVGFTSSYTYQAPPSTILNEGYYSVYTNPHGVHTGFTSMGDHTTGTGEMMIINGGPTPSDVWCETIPVLPNTNYDFSAWVANCSSVTVGPDVPILEFKINGVVIGAPTTISTAPGVWMNFFDTWNSGTNTTATICIYDQNTTAAGNDFALDDISFQQICVAEDSVYLAVKIPDTTSLSHDTTLCISGAPITLTAPAGYTTYLWNNGTAATFIPATVSGTYWVYCTLNCATLIDTFHVTYSPAMSVFLGNDTAFCIEDSLVLSPAQPAGTSYLWSNGTTGTSLTVTTTGSYWLQVSNGYCTAADTINVTVSPHPVVDLGPDTTNCIPTPVTLQSSVAYTAPAYLWNTGSTSSSIIATATGTYWLQVTVAGCSGADTVNVAILYDTVRLFNDDTAICRGKSVDVSLNANPSATFQWRPTAGIPAYMIADPVITPDTSAMYRVTVSMTGCPDIIDSFYIDVQPNPIVYAGGDRTVCQYDSLHLQAYVTPAWYTHYTYAWSPPTYLNDTTTSAVVFTAGESMNYSVFVTTPAGCSSADSAIITVYPGNFAHLDTVISLCPHDSAQLIPTGVASYVWHPGMYLSDSTASDPWVHAITSINYTGIATSQYGCLDTLSATITIRPGASIYLEDSVTLYPGDSYQINPQTNCTSFAWSPPDGLDNAYVSNPLATPQFNTKYVVTATTEWGCETKDSINIILNLSSILAVPNAFTPGNGVNNTLMIILRGEATLNYFRIYNRWGNKVFETSNISEGWDGSYHGKPQPFDVYVYEIEAVTSDGKVFKKSGNVTLIR